mmetsp:Transcript_901/g.1388  ORF Transcript_901/g.1388 Transcript_901/m.1388 type:complete len:678 (+) Transcript_901:29-2062(+)
MYGSKSNAKTGKKKSKSPLRVVLRCAWNGTRLNVPAPTTADPITLKTTLLEVVLRLESALPPSLFQDGSAASGATLVCLRNVVLRSQWESTSLKQILDGDDGQAGVVLTLDIVGGADGAAAAAHSGPSSVVNNAVVASAASSLNIKPVAISAPAVAASPVATVMERGSDDVIVDTTTSSMPTSSTTTTPMEIDLTASTNDSPANDGSQQSAISKMKPEEAWSNILQSNFDAATKDCLNTLLKIIDNLLSRPNEPKVRSLRCANATFEKKVGRITGGLQFLYSIGFVPKYPAFRGGGGNDPPETLEMTSENESRDTLLHARKVLVQSAVKDLSIDKDDLPPVPKAPDALPKSTFTAHPPAPTTATLSNNRQSSSGFNIYKGHSYNVQSAAMGAPDPYMEAGLSNTERQLQQLQSKKDRIERQIQSDVKMDRGLVAYKAGSGPTGIISSNTTSSQGGGTTGGRGDSSLIAARMKRMEEERKKREEGGFTTKAMRDLERMKKAKVYSHAQIRINFSDGTHLHAKFLPREKVSAIRSVIESSFEPSIAQSLDFDLYVAPPRRLLIDTKTLDEEELVPASKIHVSWKARGAPLSGKFLRDELFLAGGGTAAFPDAKPIITKPAAAKQKKGADSKKRGGNGPSKEELLMQRMLGKSSTLGGNTSSKKTDQDGTKKAGKPKWFK